MAENENNQPSQELPKELADNLVRALQEIAIHLHDTVGASHIVLDINHISDAISKTGQTLITGGGMGYKLKDGRQEATPLADEDPSKLANDAIERAMQSAKDKRGNA